jgi:hypothetical protein
MQPSGRYSQPYGVWLVRGTSIVDFHGLATVIDDTGSPRLRVSRSGEWSAQVVDAFSGVSDAYAVLVVGASRVKVPCRQPLETPSGVYVAAGDLSAGSEVATAFGMAVLTSVEILRVSCPIIILSAPFPFGVETACGVMLPSVRDAAHSR